MRRLTTYSVYGLLAGISCFTSLTVSAQNGEIRGTVWNDLNRDGIFDTGEPGIPNWTVFIDANTNGILDAGETSTTSDTSGNYTFNVPAGNYTIAQEVQPLWNQKTPPADFSGDVNFVSHYRDGVNGVDGLDMAYATSVSPDGDHVYAVGRNEHAVSWFSRDASTGELTWQGVLKDNIYGVDGLSYPHDVTVSPDGFHVYVASWNNSAVSIFSRDATTGGLTYVGMVKDGVNGVDGLNSCTSVTTSPDGMFLYASGHYDDAVAVFSRDSSTGELSFLQVVKNGVNGVDGLDGAYKVTVSPDGAHLYVASYNEYGVAVFSRDAITGLLTYVKEFVASGLDRCCSVTVSPDGAHVYAAASYYDYVYLFDRDGSTGELTVVESYRQGFNGVDGLDRAYDVSISPDGMAATVTSYGSDALAVFDRNPGDGRLTQRMVLKDGVNGVDGLDVARCHSFSPDGRHIYTAGQYDDSVAVFERATIGGRHEVSVAPAEIVEDIDFGNEEQALLITAAASLAEGDATATVTVDLAFPTPSDLDVTLVSDTPGELTVATATVTIPAGSATASFSIDTVDDTATDGTRSVILTASATGLTDATHTIDVIDNDFDHFAFDTIASPQTGDVSFNAVLRAVTVDGSPAPAYAGTVTLTADGDAATPSVTPGSVTLANGIWSGTPALTGLDANVILTADDGSATGTSNAFDVTFGPLDHFTWSTLPSPWYQNIPLPVTVTAEDANGYTVADFTATVNLSSAASVTPATTGAFTAGVWSDNITLANLGTGFTVTADDGAGHEGSSNTFNIEIPNLTVTFDAANATEGTTGLNGTVSIPFNALSDITVSLQSDDATELSVPASVTITTGSSSATFALTVEDDGIIDGSKPASVQASATDFVAGSEIFTVDDDESATLTLSTASSTTTEDAGTFSGLITLSPAADEALTVYLTSDDTTEATVPASITVPAGSAFHPFSITIVNDTEIDGAQSVTITSHVENWTDDTAAFTVNDDETTDLTVSLPPATTEASGTLAAAGTVSIDGTLTSDLTVSLSSNDAGELSVPASVAIPAGATSVAFDLTAVDDSLTDGAQTATITASAAGFTDGAGSVSVKDDDPDHLTVSTVSSPQTADVAFSVTVSALTTDGDPATAYTGTADLTASSDNGSAAVTPAATGNFANGQWTGSIAVSAVDTNISLTADNGASITGVSNAFDLTYGALDHFAWDTITSPKYIDYPFAATATAKDANGYTVEDFTGTASLKAIQGLGTSEITIGTGRGTWDYPFYTLLTEARTQVIYLASEIGGACTISSLSLVVTAPPQIMNHWTIRMKHTTKSSYNSSCDWESGWTTVHQSAASLTSISSHVFNFSTPFVYNGIDNLMVDFSFNNAWSSGYVIGSTYYTYGV